MLELNVAQNFQEVAKIVGTKADYLKRYFLFQEVAKIVGKAVFK